MADSRSIPVFGYDPGIFLEGDMIMTGEMKYLCNFCRKVLKDPVQTQCGHRYCRQCVEHLIQRNGSSCTACVADNIHDSLVSSDQIYKDRAILRDLSDVRVRCINDDCDWKGTYKQYDQAHVQECSRYPTTCRFCGKGDIPRNELTEHQDTVRGDCPRKPVFCKFKDVGCKELVEKDKAGEHNKRSTGEHLLMLLYTLIPFLSTVQTMKDQYHDVDEFKEQAQSHQVKLETLSSDVQKLEKQIGQLQNDGVSEKRSPPGASATNVDNLNSRLVDLHNKQTVLQTKVSTYEAIVGVLNTQIERDADSVQTLQRQRRQDRELMESLERKIKNQDRILALKDIALAEQDLRIQALEMASFDGTLVWKISNFHQKRQDAIFGKATSIYSPCFYTSRHGYKMCARIYLNGDGMGKGNHVSVFFTIMKGPFDALLRWPFRQKVTLMWLDQNDREHVMDAFRPDPTSSSFKRPVQDMNVASGCPLFMPLSQLDSPRHAYVKDDVAFLKIIVDVSDLP